MDLSKCGGICRGACKHYSMGVECPTDATYEPWPLNKCPTCAHINCHASTCPDDPAKFCDWTQLDENSGHYESTCGMSFVFDDGGPVNNEFAFCPKCGKKLKENQWEYEGE